ncbi:MAG: AraC family transcriptional regulator ligand-binding domain-containing protein [Paracoccus sp. (in: a-proteobacteria)]|uniref:AraC family transcriptional regulator ligand-binding domain-containing protein n=1 Tax=Paracoccus sp. TaxID=267 RepID=UPI0039E4900B
MDQNGPVAMIRVSSLVPVLRELDRRGLQGGPLLSRHLLSRPMLADSYAEIPLQRYVAFLEDAALCAADPLLCARVGTGFRPFDLGPVGLLFAASSTLRRGLERLAQSLNAWQGGTAIRVETDGEALTWTYRIAASDIGPHRQDSEYTLAATLALARDVFGAAGRPVEIHVEHDAPEDVGGLTRILGMRPAFGQTANRLIFDRAAAERVLRPEEHGLMSVLSRHVEDLSRPPTPGDLVERVRHLIALHLGQRPVTLALVAAELNLSTRSLQRKLAEHGTALRPLVLQVLLETARPVARGPQLERRDRPAAGLCRWHRLVARHQDRDRKAPKDHRVEPPPDQTLDPPDGKDL